MANLHIMAVSRIIFSGVSTTTVTSPFTCDATFDGNIECVIDGAVSWTAPITNVTWKSSL